MKDFLSHILILLFSIMGLNAQSSLCGTVFDSQSTARLIKLKNSPSPAVNRDGELTYIPITFHLVADGDGNGRIRFENVLDQLCTLNINFEPLGFKFYLKNAEVNEINDNTIFDNPASAAGGTKIAIEKSKTGKNAINIFITDKADTGAEGNTLGYYNPSQDYIVIKKSVLQSSSQIKFVLGHEMGHFLSLPHTFNGWDQEPWDGSAITSTLSPGGILNELADSSNCETAGDMICDTPADYNLGFGWDGCRDYDGGCKDISGKLLAPEESNFMGYFIGCDNYFFSAEQKELIKKDFESNRRSYLRVGYIPNDIAISKVPDLLTPIDDSTTDFYNGVELSWEEVENATHYLIEITQGLFKFYYTTDHNKLFLTDLKESKSYRWMVRPYSNINTCSNISASSSFTTGNMTSSIIETLTEETVNIFPNPIQGNKITIDFNLDISGTFNYKILDMNGKSQLKGVINSKRTEISNVNLAPGFYLIKFTQENSHFFKKFIVNE